MGNAIGPDVSFYQDEPETPEGIDFAQMEQVSDFVIIRAGQNLWVDSDFAVNWRESKKSGLPRGSYWFYDSRADPKRQAELWVDTLGDDLGELPLFADFEESYGGQYKGWRKWYDFLERLKTLIGNKEIAIYTAYYYWRDNAPNANSDPDSLEYFHQYPLWIANYGVQTPRVPKPWGEEEWTFWQFTEVGDGELYGVESRGIDLNYFNGDRNTLLQRFGISGHPDTDQYQLDFNIRRFPLVNQDPIGVLQNQDVLEVLDISNDGDWRQIRRTSDYLVGWIHRDPLVLVETTTPPDDGNGEPPSPPPSGDQWYRVTASALNVRSGPSTSFNKVGLLRNGEVVKALEKNDDDSWIKINRAADDLTGWCSARYLELTTAPAPSEPTPPPPDEPPEDPPPEEPDPVEPPPVLTDRDWYQVTATTLNLREGPGTSYTVIGYLMNNDIVVGLDVNDDASWAKIQRFDGLNGWCSTRYLENLGNTPPNQLTSKLFGGVTYYRKESQNPRKMVAHVLAIDMRADGLKCLVTPPGFESGLICSSKTSKFLEDFSLQVAVNGDGFTFPDPSEIDPASNCSEGREPVNVNSYAASRGTVYSQQWGDRPILYINRNNEVTFNDPKGRVYNAVSGDRMLVEKGAKVANLESQTVEPRTAAGLNKNGRWLFLVVVDGRQPGYSLGITFPELADFMLSLGVYTALNLDGGGSSTMVIDGALGNPFLLNSPIEGNIPGNEAQVANHLGFWVKK